MINKSLYSDYRAEILLFFGFKNVCLCLNFQIFQYGFSYYLRNVFLLMWLFFWPYYCAVDSSIQSQVWSLNLSFSFSKSCVHVEHTVCTPRHFNFSSSSYLHLPITLFPIGHWHWSRSWVLDGSFWLLESGPITILISFLLKTT